MHRRHAALVVLMLVLLSLLVAGPARAGGPTSVLLVVPESGQTASLYNGDADYERLAGLVGTFAVDGVAGKPDRSGTGHAVGSEVTVTWLIHDVLVWRVDRIYPGADGGPWISTLLAGNESADVSAGSVHWHTATNGAELTSLLARLGVNPGSSGGAGAVDSDPNGGVRASAAPRSAAPSVTGSASGVSRPDTPDRQRSNPVIWGLVGLVLGVLVTLATLLLSPNVRHLAGRKPRPETAGVGDSEPPAVPGVDNESNWSSADELCWPAPRH